MSCPNEEVNCNKPSPSVSVPAVINEVKKLITLSRELMVYFLGKRMKCFLRVTSDCKADILAVADAAYKVAKYKE